MRSARRSRLPILGGLFLVLTFVNTDPAAAQDDRRRIAIQPQVLQMTGSALWALPFKGEDFREDERVYWGRAIHSESGVQKYGYDLGAMRYVSDEWKEFDGDQKSNGNWYIYGKPVYAMADGKVIACWRNAPENLQTGTGEGNWHPELTKHEGDQSRIYGGGNGFWIEHADGTRVEYAHFQPGTVPASLCPHNDTLLPAVINSPAVGNAWQYIRVPTDQQKTVKKGQKLGLVGNSGTSSAPHLHVHREEGGSAGTTKSGGTPVEMRFASGLSIPLSNSTGPWTEWKSFSGKPIPPGPSLVWPSRTSGAEYARHGYPADRFGALFQHLADSGLWAEWMDFYTVGGKAFVNHVWRPAKAPWRAYFGLSSGGYQNVFNENTGEQFHPVFVDSYNSGGRPLYAVIFVKDRPGFRARHGITYETHMAEMEAAKNAGMSAVNVSVVSSGNDLRYTVLYRKQPVGGWFVKSQVPEDQYQAEYNTQNRAGRKPIYLNAYMHQGRPYISAVFAQMQTGGRKDRHGMSGAQYQSEYESALNGGMFTRAVTSFDGARSQHRFAAAWW